MTDIVPAGVHTWPSEQGGVIWAGPVDQIRTELARARQAGLVARSSALQPLPGRPGVVAVRVHLVDAPRSAPEAAVGVRSTRAVATRPWGRYVLLGSVALAALSAAGIALAMLLGALVAALPMLLGVAVVALIAWRILRGGGRGPGGGGTLTLTQTQSITFH